MVRAVHHIGVLTLAFALVFCATPWRTCAALERAAPALAVSHHQHDASAGHSQHHATHQHADDQGTPPADHHGTMKCCAMCTVASVLVPTVDTSVTAVFSSYMTAREGEVWCERTVAVDPGIPKSTV